MEIEIQQYGSAIGALGFIAVLMTVQLVVADIVGITKKHVPGTPVASSHDDVLFRVTRTVANTNESIAIFITALLLCFLNSASATYTAYAAWAYAISRGIYAICYYTNQQIARSISFAVSLLALVGLIVVGLVTQTNAVTLGMDVGWEGVVFIWVLFFWPAIVSGATTFIVRNKVTKTAWFFVAATLLSYAVWVVVPSHLIAELLFPLEYTEAGEVTADQDSMFQKQLTTRLLLSSILPIVTTAFLYRFVWRKRVGHVGTSKET